jgi:hypothetical protein
VDIAAGCFHWRKVMTVPALSYRDALFGYLHARPRLCDESSMHKSLYSRHYRDLLVQLRQLRQRQGLRQADLAMRLGRAQSLVSRVESGERRLDVIELWVWLQALDTDFNAFTHELGERLSNSAFTVRVGDVA